ncbi:MAG TPA: transglutaminase family protein [Patescibacteria group bacterium]|nr:transglutaminase family protein [Patescibacteria group bacterium]
MAIDPAVVDWNAARRASFRLVQTFRYEYPEPIRDLNHRLVVIPPEHLGDQHRMHHELHVGLEDARTESRRDRFGNEIVDVFVPRVQKTIEFVAEVAVERSVGEPNRLPGSALEGGYLLDPSALTAADERITDAASRFAAESEWGLPLADRINDWVYQSMTYRYGVTGVRTTAAEALAVGAGVCQDYAHVMLAACRACGLPARYVSGHMLGQGGTHAWVEVVLPAADGSGDLIASAFDPTHASRGGLGYVKIAVGRDYADVAPTSGTYLSPVAGRLVTSKRLTLTGIE